MAENKEIILTQEGMKKLKDELEYLITTKRQEMAEKIKVARGFGDLSENAEYDEAKKEQGEVEARINAINEMLKYARILDESEIVADEVGIGSKVKIYDFDFEEEDEYTIVSTTEADPANNKLSLESPVGKALMHGKVGDVVKVETLDGEIELKILEISR